MLNKNIEVHGARGIYLEQYLKTTILIVVAQLEPSAEFRGRRGAPNGIYIDSQQEQSLETSMLFY